MATVLIEDAGSGTHLIQDLTRDGEIFPIGIRPTGDKLTRMAARAALIEAGHVHIPEDAPWLADFLTEMMQFPHGRHDDQVDSVAQFLNWAEERRANWWTSEEIPFCACRLGRADPGPVGAAPLDSRRGRGPLHLAPAGSSPGRAPSN